MATDCVDGDYLGAYARFFAEFVARVNPDDQLPVKVSGYDIIEGEIVGEIISVTLQYLNQTYCPPSLQSYIVHLVIQAIKSTCKKQPEICGLRQQEKTYAPLKLMQAVTNEVNEICRRYLDNSRLALLPPPSSTPQVVVGATRNARRKMEDRHVVLHDLHTIFNIQDDTTANYYAVFDGHGGQDAAAYCATHLHQYLVESVYYPTDPERALRDAFLTTDAHFIAKSSIQRLNGGTTAVCVLVLDKKLYVAWVGDSMASLVKRGCVKQLVNPHRPTRTDEQERINNMGGVVVNCVGVLRVNGFLSISRAIGDVSHKPFVTGEPEIRSITLDGTEDFLIIACDGLWDHVDPRKAAQRVYWQVLQNPQPLQHALIPEADNVADSEDSEDEWNYYRIDPNKEESATAAAAAPGDEEKNVREDPEPVVKDNSEVQSSEEAGDIKCERRTEEASSELIDTDISDERELREESEINLAHSEEKEIPQQEADMDFQLNPNAAEFVPTAVSPTLLDRRNIVDFPISGSPLKQSTLVMDDIPVPTQSEFEEEVSHRPREIDEKDYTNGDHDNLQGLDVSEISSTRAELGDESIARIMATTQQWSSKMRDDDGVGPELEEYDIATDPMAMSFAPGDFEVAFERSVDLNAVHDLSGADVEADENECYAPMDNTPSRSPEPCANDDRAHTPLMDDDKPNDLLHASSTPYTDGKSETTVMSNEILNLSTEQLETLPIDQELGVSPLTDDHTSEHESSQKSEPMDLQIDNDQFTKQVEEVSENAQSAVSDLLETPNPAESCAKESSLSSMSPMQDTLECTSPQPVEEETTIPPSTEINEFVSTASAPIASPLHIDLCEFKPSHQYDFNLDISDFVPSMHEVPSFQDLQNPLDLEVPAAKQYAEDVGFGEVSSTEEAPVAAVDQHLWESNIYTKELLQEDTETPANLTAQQENDKQSLPDNEAELANMSLSPSEETTKLIEYLSQSDKLCDIRADDMKVATDFCAMHENINSTIDLLVSDQIVKNFAEPIEPIESSYHKFKPDEEAMSTNVDVDLSGDLLTSEQTTKNSEELADLHHGESAFKETNEEIPINVDMNLSADLSTQERVKSPTELVDLDYSESMFKANEAAPTNVDITESDIVVPNPFTSVEEQPQEEKIQLSLLDDAPTEILESSNMLEQEIKKEPVEIVPASTETPSKEAIAESIPASTETPSEEAIAESIPASKPETVELPVDSDVKVDKPQEEAAIAAETTTTAVTEAVTAVAAAAAVTAAIGAVTSSTKTKTATTAKRPTKTATATTTTKAITLTTKAASMKSTPTSPSKAVVSTTTARTTSTTSAQATATKKVTATRPKQLDGPAKAAVSSTTATKSSAAAKTTTAAKSATTTTTKTTVSSRVNSAATRSRTAATASVTSPKPSTTSGISDKKSTTANGDAKQLTSTRSTAAKSTTSKSTISSSGAKTAPLVKSSTTTTRTSTSVISKPRPMSASSALKTSPATLSPKPSATNSGVNTGTSRPKTAPVSSTTAKARENIAKASTVKSPMIDKQIKETANKRISLGRSTGTSSTTTTTTTTTKTGRASAPAASTAKPRVTSAKSLSTTASSPTKKTTSTSKVVASRVSTSTKTASLSNKAKPLPNGVPDSAVVTANNVITTMMNDKLVGHDDDVPRKDASPVDVPTDNQLIVTAD
ncbi:uncharacterized protein LOC105181883 isoform X2 [Harpegnathos saltator]|uniref:uncharacterized protein LOC105181883 isoform X2 n=1 Tax=Harpegnathos saltator TaxID=610380 RepID=UPI000DBEE117|nr:uncharacterized protein LOC105181883 isoform X2 [Harpegnathos saltator]